MTSTQPSFRQWVAAHIGEPVDIEWGGWSAYQFGSARVRLIGFNEFAEERYVDPVLLAVLEHLAGTSRTGFLTTSRFDVPTEGFSEQISRVLAVSAGLREVVWLHIPYIKSLAPLSGPPLRCSVYDDFEISYDFPAAAEHRGQPCPLHDEPQWRDQDP
jgi:hypothetical protein